MIITANNAITLNNTTENLINIHKAEWRWLIYQYSNAIHFLSIQKL